MLKAHTAIHNYLLKREDGSTAAERFFGKSHRDMVSYLLDVEHGSAKVVYVEMITREGHGTGSGTEVG